MNNPVATQEEEAMETIELPQGELITHFLRTAELTLEGNGMPERHSIKASVRLAWSFLLP